MQGEFSVRPKGVELFLGEKPDLNHSTFPTASWHALLVLNANFKVLMMRPIVPLFKVICGFGLFIPFLMSLHGHY